MTSFPLFSWKGCLHPIIISVPSTSFLTIPNFWIFSPSLFPSPFSLTIQCWLVGWCSWRNTFPLSWNPALAVVPLLSYTFCLTSCSGGPFCSTFNLFEIDLVQIRAWKLATSLSHPCPFLCCWTSCKDSCHCTFLPSHLLPQIPALPPSELPQCFCPLCWTAASGPF